MSQGRLTATLVAVLAICLAGGGAGAYLLGRHQATIAAADEQSTAGTSTAGASSTARSPRSSSSQSPSAAAPSRAGTSQASVSPASGSGPVAASDPSPSSPVDTAPVSLTDPPVVTTSGRAAEDTTVVLVGAAANDDPHRQEVRDLLQRHFDSINKRDYQGWKATVTEPQVGELPEAAWQVAYGTTQDTDISVIAITSNPRQAQVTFRSRQAAAQAPDKKSTCLNWRITVPLVDQTDGSLLIGRSATNSAGWQACYAG